MRRSTIGYRLILVCVYTVIRLTFSGAAEPNAKAPDKAATELKFSDFFVHPIGPTGLCVTEKLRGLNGKHVRIRGYIVRQEHRRPGVFLLTSLPIELHEEHYGLADELPAATLFVIDPSGRQVTVHAHGIIEVRGILSVGNREEADGRVSIVRLTVDDARPSLEQKASKEMVH